MDRKSVPWQVRWIPFLWVMAQIWLCFWSLDASKNRGPLLPVLFLVELVLTWVPLALYIRRPQFDSVRFDYRWMGPLSFGWFIFSFGVEHIIRRAFEALPDSGWPLQHNLTVVTGLFNLVGFALIWRYISIRTKHQPSFPSSVQS